MFTRLCLFFGIIFCILITEYRDMIIDYLEKFKKAKRRDIRKLLWDKLPAVLSDAQKENKIITLLTYLKRAGKIEMDSDNKQTGNWVLKK